MSFQILEYQEQGPGRWKMNSSICKDPQFKAKIENVWADILLENYTNIQRIDLFLLIARSIAMQHSREKANIKKNLKLCIERQLQILEQNDYSLFPPLQAFVVVDLILYSRCVCLEICAHMGIELFRIVPNPPPSQTQQTKK